MIDTMIKAGSSSMSPSSVYFPGDAAELTPLQAIARAQDIHLKSCHKGSACEDAYYARGLVALFEIVSMRFDSFRSCTQPCRIAVMTWEPLAG